MLIEVDEYKKQIKGYDPKKSELFHRESAKLADKDFLKCVKSKKYKQVVFMAGEQRVEKQSLQRRIY
jgi:hypothetical protein